MHTLVMLAEAGTTPGAEAGAGGFGKLVEFLPNAMVMVNTVWDFAMGNPLLMLGIVSAAIGIGAGIFAAIKGVVSH